MVLTADQIKTRLKKLRIAPDKWLGQHFLIEPLVYESMVATARGFLRKEDSIVEIGPGLGTLTDELLAMEKPVITLEKDPVLAQALPIALNHPENLTVLTGDALKLLALDNQLKQLTSWIVIANIPYAISSPLLRSLSSRLNPPRLILVLVQKEMAERIIAHPGDSKRGVLTVECEIMAQTEILQPVSSQSFWPEPKVQSALILMTPRVKPLVPPPEFPAVLKVVRAGFSGKRKQLANSLAGTLQREKSGIITVMNKIGISPERRAETLTIEEWRQLTDALASGV